MIYTIDELIQNRRSVFPAQYTNKPISVDLINQILTNANWAPSHKKTEPWRFKIFREAAKDRLGEFLSDTYTDITPNVSFSPFKHKKILDNCKATDTIIAICMQRDPKERVPEWEEIAAVAMAVQNMWLTCEANNIGCYWSSPILKDYLQDLIAMKDGERCLGFFYMGHYNTNEKAEVTRSDIKHKTEWIRF
ncbi:nitroreductase [Aquimarina sp. W85]|uniref:nitroreductase family protein n=1 Tax=Aquimarina rhodophyticola TaxID=3342246 RepID=UPI00366D6FF5